jgi:hypothetical protein
MLRRLFLPLLAVASLSQADTVPPFTLAVSFGGLKHDKVRCINLDAQGNILLTGEFAGDAMWGDQKITSNGDMDFFVAKLDPQGKPLWVHNGGGTKVDRGYGVAADAAGNVYVTGHSQGTDANFSGQSIPNAGDYDVFTAKYDPSGKLLWIKTQGGPGYDYGHGVAVTPQGDVVVTGALVIDKIARLFCACYTAEGKLKWSQRQEGQARGSGHGVAVDRLGNAYVGGFSSGKGNLGDTQLDNANGQDVLIAKFDTTGAVAWVHQGYGSKSAMIHEISVDEDGFVWACGMYKDAPLALANGTVPNRGGNDPLLTCLNPKGERLWTLTGGSDKVDYGLGIAADHKGGAVFVGEFSETADLFGHSLTSRGATDIFIAGINRDGTVRYVTQAGGDKGDNSYTAVADKDGNVLFSGSITGTATFGDKSVTAVGAQDVYVARIAH